jgi:heme-degrading monooxygenase HmoA
MIVDLVTFRVRSGKEQEFEALSQDALKLMRRSKGFISQVVLKSLEDPAEYHAEVRWVSKDYRDRFSARNDGDAGALKQRGASILEQAPAHRLLEPV